MKNSLADCAKLCQIVPQHTRLTVHAKCNGTPPLPGSDSAPKSVVGVSHRVFHSRLKNSPFLQILSPVTFLSL